MQIFTGITKWKFAQYMLSDFWFHNLLNLTVYKRNNEFLCALSYLLTLTWCNSYRKIRPFNRKCIVKICFQQRILNTELLCRPMFPLHWICNIFCTKNENGFNITTNDGIPSRLPRGINWGILGCSQRVSILLIVIFWFLVFCFSLLDTKHRLHPT